MSDAAIARWLHESVRTILVFNAGVRPELFQGYVTVLFGSHDFWQLRCCS